MTYIRTTAVVRSTAASYRMRQPRPLSLPLAQVSYRQDGTAHKLPGTAYFEVVNTAESFRIFTAAVCYDVMMMKHHTQTEPKTPNKLQKKCYSQLYADAL